MGANPGWKLVSHGTLRLPSSAEGEKASKRSAVVIELDRAGRYAPTHAWPVGARRGDGRRIA